MKLFFSIALISLLNINNYLEIEKTTVEQNRIGFSINDAEVIVPEVEKAFVHIGENVSGIKFKGIEAAHKFKKTDKIKFYVGRNPAIQLLAFSIIKLDVNKKNRTAKYNLLIGKKIEDFPYYMKPYIENTMVGSTNEALAPGHYTAIFAMATNGNLQMIAGRNYLYNAITFEIVE